MDTQVIFKGLPRSESLEQWVRTWAEKLERVYPRLTACVVTLDAPHRHHRHGRQFDVKVHLMGPEIDVVVSHDAAPDGAHEDAYVAVRDAFRAARRQLGEQAEIAQDVRA